VSKELLEVAKLLATDEDYRADFMNNPRKSLSDLGFSGDMVERLVPALMAVITAGGIFLHEVEPLSIPVGWR
jgi:hypothetical protein